MPVLIVALIAALCCAVPASARTDWYEQGALEREQAQRDPGPHGPPGLALAPPPPAHHARRRRLRSPPPYLFAREPRYYRHRGSSTAYRFR